MEVMETTWIVVANDSRLRVFEIRGDGGILHEVVDFLSPKGKMLAKKAFHADQHPPLASNHFTCSGMNEADLSKALFPGDVFSKQISSYIERARCSRRFAKLRIIGCAVFLELLRTNMTEATKRIIEKELVRDTISFENPMLEKYLEELCVSEKNGRI